MKEKAKKQTSVWMSAFFLQNAAEVLLTSVQKCDLIYTERFCIVKTVGARKKTVSNRKMTFCDHVMLWTAGGDFYE